MSYKKATKVLPTDLVALIQDYIDGEYIYIPRRTDQKKSWGSNTSTRSELKQRNNDIYNDYLDGIHVNVLAEKYYLSNKSIQRIILQEKKCC